MGILVATLVSAVVTTLSAAPAAQAAYAATPVGPAWTPDGPVHALVDDGSRVYVGGAFTGGVAALDAATGSLIWQGNANGDVRALAMGPNGTLLIGGAFTTVDGATHRKLAAVQAGSGAVVSTWKGAAGGTVRDLVVVGDTAYFGGAFTGHAGMAQQGLGAVTAATGKVVTTFTTSTNGQVYGLTTQAGRLFFSGKFTAVDGQTRNQLGSVTLSTNSLDGWAPAPSCLDVTKCNVDWDITADATTVYAVGRNLGAVYAVNISTGARKWTSGTVTKYGSIVSNGDAQAVTLGPDGMLYVGGHFTTIAGGQPRIIVAAFDPATGALAPFSTRFITTYPGVWALTATSTRLYVGGAFTGAGPKVNNTNVYPYLAAFPVA